MPRTLRRSARLRDKTTLTYTDPATEDELEESSAYSSESEHVPSPPRPPPPRPSPPSPLVTEAEQSYCICNKPQDNRLMICCDTCDIWYHHNCVSLSKSKANKLSNSSNDWHCPSCVKKQKKKQKSTKKNKHKHKRKKKQSTRNKRKRKRNPNHTTLSPPHKRRKTTPITDTATAIPLTEEAPRTLFTNPSQQIGRSESLECHYNYPCFPPQAEQADDTKEPEETEETENSQNTQETQDTVASNVVNVQMEENENENTDTDLEILSNVNNKNKQCEEESDDDDDILICAGDKWIKSQSFMDNRKVFEKDIFEKKQEELKKCMDSNYNIDLDIEGDKDFVVLNNNKISKQDTCPLTQVKIKNPLKNVLCSHVYEKDAILNYKKYLNSNGKELKCPQAGCTKYLFI